MNKDSQGKNVMPTGFLRNDVSADKTLMASLVCHIILKLKERKKRKPHDKHEFYIWLKYYLKWMMDSFIIKSIKRNFSKTSVKDFLGETKWSTFRTLENTSMLTSDNGIFNSCYTHTLAS